MPTPSAFTGLRNPVGTHVQVGKGLVDGRARAAPTQIGAETIQVFVGNPRGWAPRPVDPAEDAAFRAACETPGCGSFVHTPYLVNLGLADPATYERSVATVAHNLRRAAEIGAEGVVVHTGSCVDEGTAATPRMRQVREGLLPVLDALGGTTRRGCCSSRPRARAARCAPGSRTSSPTSPRSTATPRSASAWTPATCSRPAPRSTSRAAPTATVDRLVEIGGPGRLRLVHANDSMDVRGAFKDRHQRIGDGPHRPRRVRGAVRAPGDRRACRSSWRRPGSRDADDPQIALLKKLRETRERRARDRRYRPCSPPSALLAMTACWGSTFFLIKDLLDRVPVLDFLAVRFAIASVALLAARSRARCGRLTRDVAAARGGARRCCTASPRSCRPPASRTPRRACPASSPACTSCARRCSPPLLLRTRISAGHLGAPSRSRSPASRVLTLNGLSVGYGEAVTLVVRAALRAAHRRARRLERRAEQAMGMADRAAAGDHRWSASWRPLPDGIVLPEHRRRLALGGLHGGVRRGAGAGRADLGAGPPAADPHGDHHEHGAGVRGVLRGAARRRGGHRPDAGRRR